MKKPAITDAVTTTNVLTVGASPGVALASLYQTLSFATSMAASNAVFAQQQANMAHQAATIEGVRLLYGMIKR